MQINQSSFMHKTLFSCIMNFFSRLNLELSNHYLDVEEPPICALPGTYIKLVSGPVFIICLKG